MKQESFSSLLCKDRMPSCSLFTEQALDFSFYHKLKVLRLFFLLYYYCISYDPQNSWLYKVPKHKLLTFRKHISWTLLLGEKKMMWSLNQNWTSKILHLQIVNNTQVLKLRVTSENVCIYGCLLNAKFYHTAPYTRSQSISLNECKSGITSTHRQIEIPI